MFKKDIYKYKDEKGRTIISPYKPNVEYEHMYRLITQSENHMLTNYVIFTQCIDIQEKDLELWVEVHKDDLETPVSQNEEIKAKLNLLVKVGKVVANQLTDDTMAQELQEFYDEWLAGVNVITGQYIRYDGILYKVLSDHVTKENWTPDVASSLFTKVLVDPTGETINDWVQPDSTNPYMIGDKVTFKGFIYESIIDNNIWSPADYPAGWQRIED